MCLCDTRQQGGFYMLYDDYMLEKYRTKLETIRNWLFKISLSCAILGLILSILACIYDKSILGQLGVIITFLTCFISIIGDTIICRRLKERSDQEIQEFEEKVPIEKRIPIFINWTKLEKEYTSLSETEREMFSDFTWLERPKDAYLLRDRNLDGDTITIERGDASYIIYSCMSRNYDRMIELIQKYQPRV